MLEWWKCSLSSLPMGLWEPEADVLGGPITSRERRGGPREPRVGLGNQLSQAHPATLWESSQAAGEGLESGGLGRGLEEGKGPGCPAAGCG